MPSELVFWMYFKYKNTFKSICKTKAEITVVHLNYIYVSFQNIYVVRKYIYV